VGCISVYKRQGDLGPYSVLVDTIQFLPVDILHPVSPLDIHNPVSLVDIIDPVSPSWNSLSSFSTWYSPSSFSQLILSIQFLPVEILYPVSPLHILHPVTPVDILDPVSPSWCVWQPVLAVDCCSAVLAADLYSQHDTHLQRDSGAAKRDLWERGLVILG